MDCVYSALDGASVDISEKRIIWSDGRRLTIEQSAERINSEMNLCQHAIISHIIGWLQMEYVPEGLDDEQMEMFESHINAWVEEYEVSRTQSTGLEPENISRTRYSPVDVFNLIKSSRAFSDLSRLSFLLIPA